MTGSLTAQKILDEIRKCHVTHIVWLPDSETRTMYDAMRSQSDIKLVPVCREGEAIAIAAGLILGGKKPIVFHQSTGFFEAGDSVRGIGFELQLPLLLVLGYRGWTRKAPLTDSAAIFLEPVLDAWGIKHYLVETGDDIEKISMAYRQANESNCMVAVLIGQGDR